MPDRDVGTIRDFYYQYAKVIARGVDISLIGRKPGSNAHRVGWGLSQSALRRGDSCR